jgi:hypothetical protein
VALSLSRPDCSAEIFGHPVDFLHRVGLDQMVDRAGAELDRVVQVHAGHEEELPRLEADG